MAPMNRLTPHGGLTGDEQDAGTFVRTTAHRLRTQDNRITNEPVFIVQQRNRIWGVDQDYTETFAWLNADSEEVDPAMSATLEAGRLAHAPTPDGYRRVGYIDTWKFVTPCLTEAGAQAYIDVNGHNLEDPTDLRHQRVAERGMDRPARLLHGAGAGRGARRCPCRPLRLYAGTRTGSH